MGVVALLTLCGFALVLVGLGAVFGLGWSLAGGWILAIGAIVFLAAYVLDRLAAFRRSARNARRLIR
jgi:hypothetical protein